MPDNPSCVDAIRKLLAFNKEYRKDLFVGVLTPEQKEVLRIIYGEFELHMSLEFINKK